MDEEKIEEQEVEELVEIIDGEEEPMPVVKKPWERILLVIFAIILLLAAVIGGTVYYYKTKKTPQEAATGEFVDTTDQNGREGLPIEEADYDLNNWKTFISDKAKVTFDYPAGWELDSDNESYITLYMNKKDELNGALFIEINNDYEESTRFCQYCWEYKGKVENNKIVLTESRAYTQDTIAVAPEATKASGYEVYTDKFNNGTSLIQITLVKYNKATQEESNKALAVFNKLISTVKFEKK
jgi:hypothetical protein